MEQNKSTFIITSVIHFSQKKLSYSNIRSVYTPAERTGQTLKTISSIRDKVAGVSIVLVEMGQEKKISADIINAVDNYIYIGNNWLVKWACNGKYKGLGEAIGLLLASKSFKGASGMYFKISGRYFLNDDFDISMWNGDKFFFRKYKESISTRLYAFPAGLFEHWKMSIRKSLYQLYRGRAIEDELHLHIPKELIEGINILGVSGFVAPDGDFLSE